MAPPDNQRLDRIALDRELVKRGGLEKSKDKNGVDVSSIEVLLLHSREALAEIRHILHVRWPEMFR